MEERPTLVRRILETLLRVTAVVRLPDEVRNADHKRRDRLFTVLTLVVVGVNASIMIGVGWEKSQGTLPVYLIGMGLALGNLGLRRKGVSLGVTSNVLVGLVYITLAAVTLGTGGIGLAAPFALALVPMLAILMGTLRAALVWTFLALTVPALLSVLHAQDFAFPMAPDPDSVQKRFLVSMAGIVVLLCTLALLFDWLSRAALRDLSRVHQQLNVARDAAQTANRTKTRFLANMSHEIRTPMNGVLNMLDLLKDGDLDNEQSRSVDIAHRSAQALLHLLNDIVDLAKVEAGALTLEKRPFSLERTVREVVEFFSLSATSKGIKLRMRRLPDAPDGLLGDSFRLRQVLINLVGNAIKFTARGEVRVILDGTREGDVVIAVSDTGIGISGEQLEHIFDPFTQADASSTRKHGGTGLGLSISRQLVESMGGSLMAESVEGVGSKFTIRLTLEPIDDVPETMTFRANRSEFPGARVLIVEDNPVNKLVAERLLNRCKVETESVVNGKLGVAAALKGDFDVVFMDCQMPEMDGYDATRTLRERGYSRPIVALTANAMEGDREKCLACGMDDFLAKPLRKEALHSALNRWLPPPSIQERIATGELPDPDLKAGQGVPAAPGTAPPSSIPPPDLSEDDAHLDNA